MLVDAINMQYEIYMGNFLSFLKYLLFGYAVGNKMQRIIMLIYIYIKHSQRTLLNYPFRIPFFCINSSRILNTGINNLLGKQIEHHAI